jgi:hypothetical protein
MDFTVEKYKELLETMTHCGYSFQTFEEFIKSPQNKVIILRHDVDLRPNNSLRFAEIQHQKNIRGVYYFRAVPESWDENVIEKIKKLNHEIGYHYENLTTTKGNMEAAFTDFKSNLENLRKLAPVSTICMHGSPLSKFDSKDIWKENDYKTLDIIGEPYFDVDFKKVLYLTDTGRKWNGEKSSIRDFVNTSFDFNFSTTDDIIKAFKNNELPNQIMFNFHPQRWNDNKIIWMKEFVFQAIKNQVKFLLKVIRK